MRQWVDATVSRLQAMQADTVLEVGCGTGLILTRLAPTCRRYIAVDFAGPVVRRLEQYVATEPVLAHVVEVRQREAAALAGVADRSVDLVVLNSVVQYFPDVTYLLQVLAEAVRVTRNGGHIWIGDVRSLPLWAAFHTSVQLAKAPPQLGVGAVRARIAQAQRLEKELVIAPALFEAVQRVGRQWGAHAGGSRPGTTTS